MTVIDPVITIYGLREIGSPEVRYVGRTSKPTKIRLQRHIWAARTEKAVHNRYLSRWIRAVDYEVEIIVLEHDPADFQEAERRWIRELREQGQRLVNISEGGTGARPSGFYMSPEHRAKISAANRRRWSDPAARAKQSELSRGRPVSAETRAKRSANATGRRHTAESRALMSAQRKGIPKSAETRAKMRLASQLRAERFRGVPLTEEHRAKISAATKGRPKSEATKAAMRAAWARRKAVA